MPDLSNNSGQETVRLVSVFEHEKLRVGLRGNQIYINIDVF